MKSLSLPTLILLLATTQLRAQDTPPETPFAISSSASSSKNFPEWFPKMSQANIRTVRLFPEWRGLQSASGKWNFDHADELVKTAKENNLQISGLLFGAAPGTKDGGHSFPMKQLDGWSTYTTTLVDRYKNDIHNWEVWNEGNAGFNDGHHTTADYADLVATAYEAAKKADPSARIGMSVASFDAPYLDQAILAQTKAGKPNHFDYLCIHPYETLELLHNPDGEVPYLWMSRLLRDAIKIDAPEKANAEIWITEVGMPVEKKVTETDAAKALVKSYIMALAQNISKIMWFEGQDPTGEQAGFGLINRQGTPRASYTTFKTMTSTLGQTPKYLGWLALGKDNRAYGFMFQATSGPVLVAWMPAELTDNTIAFTSEVKLTDSLTGATSTLKTGDPITLTDTPLFIANLPADLITQAKANAPKNFPWGGDYSTAKTVSIELGPKPKNNGITHLGTHSQATDFTFPDGTAGFKVEGNKIPPFYIHPSFANLKTHDYFIRITLRRITEGIAGMNFAYEIADTKGQKGPMRNSGGWYSVAPDMSWQTHTWHVIDASFAKMWGYDINFKPEKSVPFVVGKVEVSLEPFEK